MSVNNLQYVLGILITFGFVLGLIPVVYFVIYPFLLSAILLQLLISICRFRGVNVLIEATILVLSLLGLIPFLGVIFRIAAIALGVFYISCYIQGSKKEYLRTPQSTYSTNHHTTHNRKADMRHKTIISGRKTVKNAKFKEK